MKHGKQVGISQLAPGAGQHLGVRLTEARTRAHEVALEDAEGIPRVVPVVAQPRAVRKDVLLVEIRSLVERLAGVLPAQLTVCAFRESTRISREAVSTSMWTIDHSNRLEHVSCGFFQHTLRRPPPRHQSTTENPKRNSRRESCGRLVPRELEPRRRVHDVRVRQVLRRIRNSIGAVLVEHGGAARADRVRAFLGGDPRRPR